MTGTGMGAAVEGKVRVQVADVVRRQTASPDASGAAPAGADGTTSELARRLRGLVEIAKVPLGVEAFEDLLKVAAEKALEALDAASLSVSVVERDRGWMRVLLNVGALGPGEEPEPDNEVYPLSDYPVFTQLFEQGLPYSVDIDNPDDVAHDPAASDLLQRLGKGSALAAPILLEGRVWGELFATRFADQPRFGPNDLDYAVAVAGHIAAALAQVQRMESIARLAYTDSLTGLANRRALDDRLDAALAEHRQDGRCVSLVVVDVNGLKRINDERGHEAGDRALVHVSGLLSTSAGLATGSLAARTGGDEFCIILEGHSPETAVRVAEDLCRRAGASLAEGLACGVASTGEAVGPVETPARLFRLADAAQARAKRSRSKQPVVAGRGLPQDATVRLADVPRPRRERRDRRSVRPPASVSPSRVLASVLQAFDHAPVTTPGPLMELLGETVAQLVDAAAWCVSHVRKGDMELATYAYAAYRTPVGSSSEAQNFWAHAEDLTYVLTDYPMTQAALAGAAWVVDVRASDADPAELDLLARSGYQRNLMAGGRDRRGDGWLIEIFTDDVSAQVDDLAPTVRALLAVALANR